MAGLALRAAAPLGSLAQGRFVCSYVVLLLLCIFCFSHKSIKSLLARLRQPCRRTSVATSSGVLDSIVPQALPASGRRPTKGKSALCLRACMRKGVHAGLPSRRLRRGTHTTRLGEGGATKRASPKTSSKGGGSPSTSAASATGSSSSVAARARWAATVRRPVQRWK